MLELKLYGASRYGKRRPDYYHYIDDTYTKTFQPGIYQFVLDQKVRAMTITKESIEKLEGFPVFILDNEEVTKEYLPKFIKELENYMGKLEYTTKRGQSEQGVLNYLKDNGVEIPWILQIIIFLKQDT